MLPNADSAQPYGAPLPPRTGGWSVCLFSLLLTPSLAGTPSFGPAEHQQDGWLVHSVNSEFQAGTTRIHVLLPKSTTPEKRYRVLFVLPVEPLDQQRWGNAREEVLRHELHNRHQLICVYPTFSHLPWYADHPENRLIRQESYFLRVVLPFVERHYPVQRGRSGRLLVGFSKSGWGAFSLLLRHPDVFARAAAWDAPLCMARPNRFGMGEVFATQENFAGYQLTSLLEQRVGSLQSDTRLMHLGYDNFRDHHRQMERQLVDLNIPHAYRDGPQRNHAWNSGWLPEAVELLVAERPADTPPDDQEPR